MTEAAPTLDDLLATLGPKPEAVQDYADVSSHLPVHMSKEGLPLSPLRQQFEGRWKWWYGAIIDIMLEHPDWSVKKIAEFLKKSPATLYAITGTDMFKEQLRSRREVYNERHDAGILARTSKIAELGLDAIIATLDKKKDAVPLPQLMEVTKGALDRLGYGPQPVQTPAVQITNNNVVAPQMAVPVNALLEARGAIRKLENTRTIPPPMIEVEAASSSPTEVIAAGGAESHTPSGDKEESGAPFSLASE